MNTPNPKKGICAMSYCNKETDGEVYCLRCEKLMYDAWLEGLE